MIQFSFYVFITHLICIVYLMNSGEEYVIQFAKSAGLTHLLLKVQFFIMSLCYIGLAYSCLAQHDLFTMIISFAKASLTRGEYYLSIGIYVLIHLLWCTHFVDLSVRAHVYKHSKSGVYDTKVKRLLVRLFNYFFSSTQKSKHNGN